VYCSNAGQHTPVERNTQAMLFGARLVLVRDSSVSECIDLIEELTASSNWENLTTATSVNPYHIEGTKNAAFEIAEDFG